MPTEHVVVATSQQIHGPSRDLRYVPHKAFVGMGCPGTSIAVAFATFTKEIPSGFPLVLLLQVSCYEGQAYLEDLGDPRNLVDGSHMVWWFQAL